MSKYLALEVVVEITDDFPQEDILDQIHTMFCKDPHSEYCVMQSAACTSVDSIEKAYDWLGL